MKKELIIGGVILLMGIGIGRFTLPAKVVTQVKTIEVVKQVLVQDTSKADHSVSTTTETRKADGTVTIVTQRKNDIDTKIDRKVATNTDKTSESTKTTEYDTRRLSLSVITAARPLSPSQGMSYGGSLQYRVLGPITGGILGLSDGTVGISIGLMF